MMVFAMYTMLGVPKSRLILFLHLHFLHFLTLFTVYTLEKLFQKLFTSSSGNRCFVVSVGKPLPHSADGLSAPYSTTTSSSMQFTKRQNSFSTTGHGTDCINTSIMFNYAMLQQADMTVTVTVSIHV